MTLILFAVFGLLLLCGSRCMLSGTAEIEQLKTTIEEVIDRRCREYGKDVDGLKVELREMQRKLLRGYSEDTKTVPGRISERSARCFGLLGYAVAGSEMHKEWARKALESEFGFNLRAMSEGDPGSAGVLVPDEAARELIRLVNEYGVFRRDVRVWPMKGSRTSIPKRRGGLTVYDIEEAGTLTPSDLTFDLLRLQVTKMGTLAVMSRELDEGSIVAMGELVAEEVAMAFTESEDDQGFNGDGSATYFGTIGIIPALTAIASNKSVIAAAGNAWSEVTLANVLNMVGTCKSRARRRAKWYCHPMFFYNVLLGLAFDQGGSSGMEAVVGLVSGTPKFLGYPVEFVEVMPSAEANSSVPCIFGDLRGGCLLGESRRLEIESSEHVYFTSDQIAIRAMERIDINVHDRGSAAEAGGIIALQLAAA